MYNSNQKQHKMMEFMRIPDNKRMHIHNPADILNITKDITEIYLHCLCEEYITYLPSHIESILIYNRCDTELNNLPPNLKKLYLGHNYNYPLYYLPDTLEYLCICYKYSQDLLHLPKKIKILELYTNNIKNINLDLPNLTILSVISLIGNDTMYENIMNIYNQLYRVKNTLKELYFPPNFRENLDILENFTVLEKLSYKHNTKIDKFPPNLKVLELIYYDHPLDNLPDTVQTLILGTYFKQDLNILPKNLKVLNMSKNIDCNLFVNYPETLEELIIIETHPDRYHICGYEKYKFKITLIEDVEDRCKDLVFAN
jgi:hypothetical protein